MSYSVTKKSVIAACLFFVNTHCMEKKEIKETSMIIADQTNPLTFHILPNDIIIEIYKQIYHPKGYVQKQKVNTLDNLRALMRLSGVCKKLHVQKDTYFKKFMIHNVHEAFYINHKIDNIKITELLATDDLSSRVLIRKALLMNTDSDNNTLRSHLSREDAAFFTLLTLQFMEREKYSLNEIFVSSKEYSEPLISYYIRDQEPVLIKACQQEKWELVELFLKHGANPTTTYLFESWRRSAKDRPRQVSSLDIITKKLTSTSISETEKRNLMRIQKILLDAIAKFNNEKKLHE
jgi:hypothetical protein